MNEAVSVAVAPEAAAAGRGRRAASAIDRSQPDWYKDAIIYQLHVKAYQDASNDGIGDFAGLMQRLDYIENLGVTAIWLLPFYPSPLRDDGYDIADYRAINPSYGTMRDFKRFVAEAHRRGIRVITELVVNHTSDEHPWFQRARSAKPGSAARSFYVWSDTDQKYQDTRIIFIDTEKSNWTWDPVARAYFWHRFYSHQPDLNFDNPRVLNELIKVLHFWLDIGVDGLRLDAVPYLVEREGTNNENLPETHDILRRIRRAVDERYADRMLLAEANQWPEDTRPYFGEGDECHMAFHFPLMPRIYMALAQEDRHPITDIIRQTPEIPPDCQWAIFLRNHDELTLEMVTDEERDYLWSTYAGDRRSRINLGIRRRLAPLMGNDRRKIELMNALLFSMPGTPIVYYGDELGMGDNYYLGDRDGVRTPMQWSGDRNGGFSRANPQQLYLPPIMDPVFGYQSINVEAQQGDASSLLNWMRRMIAVRKQRRAFGRGTLSFLYPHNRKVLAYIREYEDERILCVYNLSRAAQSVELDLSPWRGGVPIELAGGSAFPPVGDLPYMLTLPGYGFFWFMIAPEADVPRWHTPTPEPLPEFITVTLTRGDLMSAVKGRDGRLLERDVLPEFLKRQRWFAAKDARIEDVSISPIGALANTPHRLFLLDIRLPGGAVQSYFLPLTVLWGEANVSFGAPKLSYTLAKARSGPRIGALVDGARDEGFIRDLAAAIQAGGTAAADGGAIAYEPTEAFRAMGELESVRPLSVEQSNISAIVGEAAVVKVYRRLQAGRQPELEMGRFLTEVAGFANTPAFLGAAEYRPDKGEPAALASAFAFMPNQGDAWGALVDALDRSIEDWALAERVEDESEPAEMEYGFPLDFAAVLGRRTAELHGALAVDTDDPAFRRERITRADIGRWVDDALAEADRAFARLQAAQPSLSGAAAEAAAEILDSRAVVEEKLEALRPLKPSGSKTRTHGDYHLGQVLVAQTDAMIIDFEGEPQRGLEERRRKTSPLRDVAGMLRSFDYAAWAALGKLDARHGEATPEMRRQALAWRRFSERAFLETYRSVAEGSAHYPREPATAERLTDLFLLEKAFYEIGYEAANRPGWLPIPIRGVLDLLKEATEEDGLA